MGAPSPNETRELDLQRIAAEGEKQVKFSYTTEQEAVLEMVSSGTEPLIVDAVAGGGKTSTIIAAAKSTTKALFLAFNRSIADEIKNKYRLTSRTLHSLGYAICRAGSPKGAELDKDRTERFLRVNPPFKNELLDAKTFSDRAAEIHVRRKIRYSCKLVSALKSYGVYPDDDRLTRAGIAGFSLGIGLPPAFDASSGDLDQVYDVCARYIGEVYLWEYDMAPLIDFDDMLYVAVALLRRGVVHIQRALRGAKTVFVDEAQDLNPVQHDMLRYIAGAARIVAVGDRGQAIYGFRGAVGNSIGKMKEMLSDTAETECEELPLNTCFRCPSKHITLAAEMRPGIRPMEGAIAGKVEHVLDNEIPSRIITAWGKGEQDTIVICRRKAPLLGVAIRLLVARIPVVCQGADLISRLLDEIESFPRDMPTEECYKVLFDRYEKIIKKAKATGLDKSGAIIDWLSAVSVVTDQVDTVGDVVTLLYDLKNQHSRGAAVKVMTIHRAKGLEAKNVWLLQHDTLPMIWRDMNEEAAQQERNVLYVALTRSRKNLYLGISEN